MRFSTIAIRAGQPPDPTTGAISFPIYQTSTYVQEEPAKHKGFSYSRTENPTRKALEENIAALEGAFQFANAVRLFSLGESLGTVFSLVNHPARMTHASIPKDVREKTGITDGLLRLSGGCEDVNDLIEDLQQAIEAIKMVDREKNRKEISI